jgi:lysine 2,3-aminomutase
MSTVDLATSLFSMEKDERWSDWKWQQTHAVRDTSGLKLFFPNINPSVWNTVNENGKYVRFQLTPYLLSLIQVSGSGTPIPNDPIWSIYVPTYDPIGSGPLSTILGDNWELPEDMINPILQHKYNNRVNFRIQNRCLAYCTYCFEAKRVLDKDSTVGSFRQDWFNEALDYIRSHGEVDEVVISGGEPLTLSNERLDDILGQIRSIRPELLLRIQTRALAQNPFRMDFGLVEIIMRHNISALGIHLTHPIELTPEFVEAVERLSAHGNRPLLLAQIPLLKGINDDVSILKDFFLRLYALKIKPYYLIHGMPETAGTDRFRTCVRRGVELMLDLKRKISNPALPEYIIVHAKGKHTVPLELNGTPEFQYLPNRRVRFLNWKREWCEYMDI